MNPAGITVTLPGTGPQVQISDLPETWTQGDRIYLNSIPIAYASGSNNTPSTQNSWVRDFSPPRKLILAADPGLTYDSNDTAFVGYDETGTDDATYTLFYARRSLPVDAQYITDNVDYAEVLTNPTMLEYMLVRAQDAPILDASQGKLEWRMVTTWPKGLPGLGRAAERLAGACERHLGEGSGQHRTEVDCSIAQAVGGAGRPPPGIFPVHLRGPAELLRTCPVDDK